MAEKKKLGRFWTPVNNVQAKKTRPLKGRIMVRAAGAQFLGYTFGIPELLDDDFIEVDQREIDYLKKQRVAPHLSDEYIDD